MTDEEILTRIERLIAGIAGPERTPEHAGPDTPLGQHGYWLDSLDVLEVILACEREFGIVFEDGSSLNADALLSARKLAVLVGRLSRT